MTPGGPCLVWYLLTQPGDAPVEQVPLLELLAQRDLVVDVPVPVDAPVVRGVRRLTEQLPLYRGAARVPLAGRIVLEGVQRPDPPVRVPDEQHLPRDVRQ